VGKAAKKKLEKKKSSALPPATPNWPLLGLAGLGIVLAGYLTVAAWTGKALQGCPVGSACDVVLTSSWARLLGLPTSFWGLLLYAGLALSALSKDVRSRWKIAWSLALFGVLYSGYLTSVSVFRLDAACPYCLGSAALLSAILALTAYQRPAALQNFAWPSWLLKSAGASAGLVLLIHLHYSGVLGKPAAPEDPTVRALAEHLARSGAKFYGAWWCPHCTDQKEMFGASAHRLPYIECSPGGRRGPQAKECEGAAIRSYPTWIINGQRFEGVLSLKELSARSGFQARASP
jgi:uncharacterized membrane protein/glutaredoxin